MEIYDISARNYDPKLGRFYSLDPLPSAGSPYVYCNNNPLRYVDPSGMDPYDADWWISRIGAEAYYEAVSHGPGHVEMGGEDNAGVSSFASYPGSMSSFMRANPGFAEQVRTTTYIADRMSYYAKHDYFRNYDINLKNGTTMTEKYFNVITMSEGTMTYDYNYIMGNKGAFAGYWDALSAANDAVQGYEVAWYIDFNVNANSPKVIGGTTGIMLGTTSDGDFGAHFYGGLGGGLPGIGVSVTYSDQNIVPGFNWGIQGAVGPAFQGGQHIQTGAGYTEWGLGASFPGGLGIGGYIFYVF